MHSGGTSDIRSFTTTYMASEDPGQIGMLTLMIVGRTGQLFVLGSWYVDEHSHFHLSLTEAVVIRHRVTTCVAVDSAELYRGDAPSCF